MDTEVEFTDDEIREELARLGYKNVPKDKLAEFKRDLMKLIHSERSKSNSLNSSIDEWKSEGKQHSLRHSPVSPELKGDVAVSSRPTDFTNHGNQWTGSSTREDWNYGGRYRPTTDVTSASTYARRPNVPGSYGLYEMPLTVGSTGGENYAGRNFNNYAPGDAASETDSERRFMKRKTSRKASDGKTRVDESFSDSEAAGIYEIYEKIKNLAMRDCECGKTRPTSAETEPPYRIKGVNKNPSVIKVGEPPHTRNLVRNVPFKRYQMYQRLWKAQPAIGDDVRHPLRKAVHAKMLEKDEIKVYHKVFVNNPYVVPTEKPRYDVRWAVRKANAQYEMPRHGFYHEV